VTLPGTRIGLHPEGAGCLSFLQVARDLQIAGKGEKEFLLVTCNSFIALCGSSE
jgi:hypothetical protein